MEQDHRESVRKHYEVSRLQSRVEKLLGTGPWPWHELAEVDQFHVMGSEATRDIALRLQIPSGSRFLDVGCGFGGPARYLAGEFGLEVSGIDLSPGYAGVATWLAHQTGLSEHTHFLAANATALPFGDGTFLAAWTLHVGMNVPDKAKMYREIARVLAPGGSLAVLDFVEGHGSVTYPLPWAKEATGSFLVGERQLDGLLRGAGFSLEVQDDWTERALQWLRRARPSAGRTQTNLVSLVFGSEAKVILQNLTQALMQGQLQLVLRVGRRH